MRILLVNDDGYTSAGIRDLAKALTKQHEVLVVAPHKCNSGMAHAMTFYRSLYLKKIENPSDGYDCYSFTGTPADCVKVGTELMIDNPPDLIISGINTEPNIGTAVAYSGTAHSAMEGSILGYKSIAISSNPEKDEDYAYIVDFFIKNLDFYISLCTPDYALNINVNNERIGNKGHKICPLGARLYTDEYIIGEEDENGIPYTLVGDPIPVDNPIDCDVNWFESGYATISPVACNYTSLDALASLKEMVSE